MPTLTRVLMPEDLRAGEPGRLARAWRARLAYAKAHSQNRKLGGMHVTYAAQVTCPRTCPFLQNGCYAESGHTGIYLAQPMRRTAAATAAGGGRAPDTPRPPQPLHR
jgi:hypothetical protein